MVDSERAQGEALSLQTGQFSTQAVVTAAARAIFKA